MYDCHYSFIRKRFDAELLFTHTDSLTYEIKSEDVYEGFLSTNICLTLVTVQKILDPTNKKIIGKMKDESEQNIIDEFA